MTTTKAFKGALVAFAIAVTALAPVSSQARVSKTYKFSFHAPLSCALACAYQAGVSEKYNECSAPFPGTKGQFYADKVVTAPRYSKGIVFRIKPTLDWDSFICDGQGKHKTLSNGANTVGLECEGPIGILLGCYETNRITVRPGHKYILRAYNYSDVTDCPATYYWRF